MNDSGSAEHRLCFLWRYERTVGHEYEIHFLPYPRQVEKHGHAVILVLGEVPGRSLKGESDWINLDQTSSINTPDSLIKQTS